MLTIKVNFMDDREAVYHFEHFKVEEGVLHMWDDGTFAGRRTQKFIPLEHVRSFITEQSRRINDQQAANCSAVSPRELSVGYQASISDGDS